MVGAFFWAASSIGRSKSMPETVTPRRASSIATRPVPHPASKTVSGRYPMTKLASPWTSAPDAASRSNRSSYLAPRGASCSLHRLVTSGVCPRRCPDGRQRPVDLMTFRRLKTATTIPDIDPQTSRGSNNPEKMGRSDQCLDCGLTPASGRGYFNPQHRGTLIRRTNWSLETGGE